MKNLMKNDLVFVIDNSWTVEIKYEGICFKHFSTPGNNIHNISPVYWVISTNKKLPAKQDWFINEKKIFNDTIIEEFPNGRTYLIKKDFLIKVNSEEAVEYVKRYKSVGII